MLDSIVLNYPSLSMITNAVLFFIFFLGILTIPEKSVSTKLMAVVKLTNSFVALGYVFTQSFLYTHPAVRAFSMAAILLNQIFLIQIIFYFPGRLWNRFSNGLLFLQILFSIPLIFSLFYFSINANSHFDFHGHTIELEIGRVIKFFGLHLIFFISIGMISSIVKIFLDQKENRKANILLFLYMFVAVFLNAINYSLHKAALFDRGTFMVFFCITSSIGFFLLLVSFFNNTKDRTSFLYKLVGSAFLSFYLIYNIMNFFGSRNHDIAYDKFKVNEAELISSTANQRESDFLRQYSPITDSLETLHNSSEFDPIFLEVSRRSYLRSLLENPVSRDKFPEKAFSNDKIFLAFYNYLKDANNDPKIISQRFAEWDKISYFFTQKVYETEGKNFRKSYLEILNKEKKRLKEFHPIAIEFIESNTDDDNLLKQKCFLLFSPSYSQNSRGYAIDALGNRYLTYRYFNPKTNTLQISGYSYESYRREIHKVTVPSFYVFIIGLVIFLVGIPILLSRTLSNPLAELLNGVKNVDQGNLDTIVKIKYQDEIGYLAQSFNNMVSSIKDSKQQLRDYADNLEIKVEERTKELKMSLEQVEKLKEQQDADYFLTTLLIEPLSVNRTDNSKVQVDFFTKQKKEFQFKKKQHQIGGDICIAQYINLRRKEYIAFINADAMGKSIQGAGGVLVLGSVFHSIIERTKSYSSESDISPEPWIKKAFKELHKVFETFEGSMLISMIFGLVDEKTGLMYYMNVEHPSVILYRDEKASFLPDKKIFKKLGSAIFSSGITISTFQMLPGDQIIMGSDGKDDFIISQSESGRQINEDENIFLTRVETTKGDIHKLYDLISTQNELIDDFSILSIKFPHDHEIGLHKKEVQIKLDEVKQLLTNRKTREQGFEKLSSLYREFPNQEEIVKILIRSYSKKGNFPKAKEIYSKYTEYSDHSTEILSLGSILEKRLGNYEESIKIGERVKLREPENVKNLIHLADLFIITNKKERARKIIDKIAKIHPNHKKLEILETKLVE